MLAEEEPWVGGHSPHPVAYQVPTRPAGFVQYDAVSRLRDSQLGGDKVHDIANYIKKGKLWEAFDSDRQVVFADRRGGQGRYRF